MRRFQSVKADEFGSLVRNFPWTRRITEVHLHHTWRPRQKDYAGLRTIEAMWRTHTQVNKWSDIAQHVTVAPDGTIWIGRNFNWSPASASGFNGNSKAGPFMIEMIGDFDTGREVIDPEQKAATLAVIKAVQQRFGLKAEQLRFHNEMSAKSCPGTSQSKAQWIADVEAFALSDHQRDGSRDAFSAQGMSNYEVITAMNPMATQSDDMAGADHPTELPEPDPGEGGRGLGQPGIDPAILDELSNHIVNLTQGRFSRDGIVRSDEGDVDRIVGERLTEEIARAKAGGEKARLLVYAHGGLTTERTALLGAYDQLRFWNANHVYPLFFIWETGLAETLKQMLSGARGLAEAPRGMIRDWLDDRVEDTVRLAGADKIWSGMKRSAELASAPKGGAAYFADRIGRLMLEHGDDIELHLVGHSAGSIFHTHFVAALGDDVTVKSAHFLAPAVTSELFLEKFAPEMDRKVKELTIFTMTKARELADTVTPLYAKSLLYMIYHALEPEREADILGLETSLRRDPALRELFNLDGRGNGKAEIIWSPSNGAASGSASNSTSHGGFDNDGATLESVCRRIKGKLNGEPISPYVAQRAATNLWDGAIELPDELRPYLGPVASTPVPEAPRIEIGLPIVTVPAGPSPVGRRRALCFGIDNYQYVTPLNGCLNDTRSWSNTLSALGFEIDTIKEEEATAEVILQTLREFTGSAAPGDRLVVQYAGHGTLFPDQDGDEKSGDDSAICAIDCNNPSGEGGMVLDDDIYEAVKLLPKGVDLTMFFDCCHSGTVMRALGGPPLRALPADAKARAVNPEPGMVEAWQKMRGRRKTTRAAARALAGSPGLVGVQFGACQDKQVAYEFNGAGHFTSIATQLLGDARGLTNRQFHDRVIAKFGAGARQEPNLYCDPAAFDHPLSLF